MFSIDLSYDTSWLYDLGDKPLYYIAWYFLIHGGWILFALSFVYGFCITYVYLMQARYDARQTYIYLAIDIPKNNIQTPRAVENIFVALAGAHSPMEFWEKKIKGEFQLGFSFEIVSIDGYIQFIIRTPIHFRGLVEASIYSQYPDAEITEVNDYTADVNAHFPSDEYNIWGADLALVRPEYFPIRTYINFQEELDKEFKDPMAALLEIMNKIGPGEQIWLQLLVIPSDNDWHIGGRKAIDKILGIKPKETKNLLDKITDLPLQGITMLGDQLLGIEGAVEEKKDEKFDINRLTPIAKVEVEGIARKADKINFNCKFRYIYFGKKEVFKKALGVSGMMGAIKQYNSTASNGFKPDKNKTQARIMFVKPRLALLQNLILKNYKERNGGTCNGTYHLSVEEIATIWHFPYIEVKAPLVKKIESKRSSAPLGLPLESTFKPSSAEDVIPVESVEPTIDYDNDYFESRFAKDKTGETDRERKEEIMKEYKIENAPGERLMHQVEEESPIEQPTIKSVEEKTEPLQKKSGPPPNLPFA